MKLRNIEERGENEVWYHFTHAGQKHAVWFKVLTGGNCQSVMADTFALFGFVFAQLHSEAIDLGGYPVCKKLLSNLNKASVIYKEWFPELKLSDLHVENYHEEQPKKTSPGTAMCFTAGVDSHFALQRHQSKISQLLYVEGFDNHYRDKHTSKWVRSTLKSAVESTSIQPIIIRTNLREFTEKYINWVRVYGACLASSIAILQSAPQQFLIPGSWSRNQLFKCGSHPLLDHYFGSARTQIEHIDSRSRLKKIKKLTRNKFALSHMRVCWQNPVHRLNCGACEKCMRTMLAFLCFLPKENIERIFNTEIRLFDVCRIKITSQDTYNFFSEIIPKLPNKHSQIKRILKEKLCAYTNQKKKSMRTTWPPPKQKSVLFIDFNGVLSYQPFWFSLQDASHPLHNIFASIEKYLFEDNPVVVKNWMYGRHTSEEIHDILSREIHRKFDRDALFATFTQDCNNLDISKKILDYLEQMKNVYHLILTTDNMDSFDRFTLPANPRVEKTFDDVSNSYNVGYGKSDHNCALFWSFIKKYDANRTHCILLDNSSRNCSVFEKHTGGRAIQVNSEAEVLSALDSINKEHESKWKWQY